MHTLYNRTMSAIPVSIGTSLALESIFVGEQPAYDPARPIPQKLTLNQTSSDYSQCWINVETLIRNIASAVKSTEYLEAKESHVLDVLYDEMRIIDSVFRIEGGGVCTPIFYADSYKDLQSRYGKLVKFRKGTTVAQKHYEQKSEAVINSMIKEKAIVSFDSEIKPDEKTKALIISHIAWDLLSHENFKKLDLLESHTGILKTKADWNTKYAPMGSNDLKHFPFERGLLLIFGDKALIQSSDWKLRKLIYDISITEKWTAFTTRKKIEVDIKLRVLEPYVRNMLLSLF